jgi:hypothetical protein
MEVADRILIGRVGHAQFLLANWSERGWRKNEKRAF